MKTRHITLFLILILSGCLLTGCNSSSQPGASLPPPPKKVGDPLVAKGRRLFFEETFNGNGRTCGTCHRAENNLTIDPTFIASLPKDDPLFVAEFIPALSNNFENPKLMREFGLIVENQDSLNDLENNFNMRSVSHVFAQGLSTDSNPRIRFECGPDPDKCPRTGWSGDGAPDDLSLRAFATGAVRQHFTKTTQRREGIDFRLPTADELDALEAFQLSLGRQQELALPLPLKSLVARRGQEIFSSPELGRCGGCHANGGANSPFGGNLNFNTGVEDLPDHPEDLAGEKNTEDDGLGNPGNGTFNTPSIVEAADTGPFFHNHSVETIEGAVAFYTGQAFNNSPSGRFLRGCNNSNPPVCEQERAIDLDTTQVISVAAFLRVINALENVRELNKLLGAVHRNEFLDGEHPQDVVTRAVNDIDDAIDVLKGGGLHPLAVKDLKTARKLTVKASKKPSRRISLSKRALSVINRAKKRIVG